MQEGQLSVTCKNICNVDRLEDQERENSAAISTKNGMDIGDAGSIKTLNYQNCFRLNFSLAIVEVSLKTLRTSCLKQLANLDYSLWGR